MLAFFAPMVASPFLGGVWKAAKGIAKVLWGVATTKIAIPIGVIVILIIAGYVYNRNAISNAITELIAGAALEAQSAIIDNKNKLINNKDQLLAERARIIEDDKDAMHEFLLSKMKTESELRKAENEIEELRKARQNEDPTNVCNQPAAPDYFERLLNK